MTTQYGLLGHPLGHSLSPFLHSRLFALRGQVASYDLLDAPSLNAVMPQLAAYRGYNVTIPYKTEIIPYLDILDESAARYGAVNCVARDTAGRQIGYNTDCTGFLSCVSAFALDGKVLLLGCGGAGRMMATEAVRHGASLTIAVRARALAETTAFAAALTAQYPGTASAVTYDKLTGNFDLLLNATPVGMYPHMEESPVSQDIVARCGAVFDAIYNPARTRLLQFAAACDIPAVGGMEMLVRQACCAHTIWYGADFSEPEIMTLLAQAQQQL